MFCEPNLKNRDMNEDIKKSKACPELAWPETVSALPAVAHERRSLAQAAAKRQKFVSKSRANVTPGLEFKSVRR